MITVRTKGDFGKSLSFLKKATNLSTVVKLDKYGRKGVDALSAATPVDSGTTASSWSYDIVDGNSGIGIVWKNSNVSNGVNVAVIIQYGHATGTGGYVKGIDYINPALKPIFDEIADDIWKEVVN